MGVLVGLGKGHAKIFGFKMGLAKTYVFPVINELVNKAYYLPDLTE